MSSMQLVQECDLIYLVLVPPDEPSENFKKYDRASIRRVVHGAQETIMNLDDDQRLIDHVSIAYVHPDIKDLDAICAYLRDKDIKISFMVLKK